MTTLGQDIMARLDEAARFSEPGPGVTRFFLTPEHRQVADLVRRWMEEAGLAVHMDAAGTVVGRLEGPAPDAPTLIVGSHVDTVREGGKYDGMLGVVMPIVCAQEIRRSGTALPYALEIVAFGDEEGARFPTTLIGSRALSGLFDPATLDLADRAGVTLGQAFADFGLDPAGIPALKRDPEKTLGYVEVHIEQGPVLEAEDLPVGVVTAITGIERHTVAFTGKASHAGTTPMETRRDALAGAAQAIAAVERIARETDDLVGTVGSILMEPNVINVIPARCELGVELRSPERGIRETARRTVLESCEEIARARGLGFEHTLGYEEDGAACSPRIVAALKEAVEADGYRPRELFSGAGHDGLAMSALTDIGMLFVRCRDGLSHHPDEHIAEEDADAGARVLLSFLTRFGTPRP
ncbi:allantoate amidohydrolase [Kaustia mangrovi]|uniref:allantoate amidohydrolase n=1 Tax=Kaustia mangrovi TaxID=2593653 RepID=UPI001FE906F9|nr:allantoate amidohydrolase [Kaustia mangrovi]